MNIKVSLNFGIEIFGRIVKTVTKVMGAFSAEIPRLLSDHHSPPPFPSQISSHNTFFSQKSSKRDKEKLEASLKVSVTGQMFQ